MKIILIDTNYNYLGPEKPIITPHCVESFGLHEGEHVIVYQDEDEWEGIVCYDDSLPEEMRWYIKISDIAREVSAERIKSRNEGYMNGLYLGELTAKINIAKALLKDGMNIEKVRKYTGLSHTRLKCLQEMLLNNDNIE